MNLNIQRILNEITPYRAVLLNHPVYNEIKNLKDFRVFMENHVFAVWDFMTLLKALQMKLTGTSIPWIPSSDPIITRLINDIVLAEESDEDGKGGYCSHFELYLRSMKEAGANTEKITDLISMLTEGQELEKVVEELDLPEHILHFLEVNYRVVKKGKAHEIAASFTLGREELIPDMFRRLVNDLISTKPSELSTLKYYFDRHIHLDEDHHGPLALRMLEQLCGNDAQKWNEAEQAAKEALEARKVLWDGINKEILALSVQKIASY
ncbi:DUF3050 domain-containing protein [Aquiflexum gelatinilyticum]|uniref:DUF3050 domain-containing protein n=1 Tax=Aquiflexum gelatinilyticum TaxID=2961943 RepID=UPI00216A16BB|nr:DUF3050 domain-containing protein [Aquiflexum gelatinilyticum]MCS4433782.1 DUF3050 domain-containing protein [Aquiflexum gelatinilyticum]